MNPAGGREGKTGGGDTELQPGNKSSLLIKQQYIQQISSQSIKFAQPKHQNTKIHHHLL